MKQTIGVFFGGQSTEHDISIVTAISSVIKPLRASGAYDVLPIYIAKSGRWYSDKQLEQIEAYQTGKIDDLVKKAKPVRLLIDDGLTLELPRGTGRKQLRLDAVFPALHGTKGEDGAMMGLLEMANVPYVGCNMPASTIAMDKALAKTIVADADVAITPFVSFSRHEYEQLELQKNIMKSINLLNKPLFIKPVHLGSSIAVARAETDVEIEQAIEVALHYDDKVIVEEAVGNLIEVTVPIIGNQQLIVGYVERPLLGEADTFDFETKYLKHGASKGKSASKGVHGYSELPATLDKELYKKAEAAAEAAYRGIGCTGIARVDLLIDKKTKTVYFNEINPMPGSLYRHNWAQKGISAVDLVEQLIDYAFERHEQNIKQNRVFDSNFLAQAQS